MSHSKTVKEILKTNELKNLCFDLVVVKNDNLPYKFNPIRDNLIEKGWNKLTQSWDKIDRKYYNLGLYNFSNILDIEGKKTIQVTPNSSYKQTVGLRVWRNNKKYEKELISIESVAPKTLSAIALIKDLEGNILWKARNSGDWEASLELLGGFVRSSETNLKTSLINRLKDDLGIFIKESDLEIIKFLHINDIYECMAVFEIIIDSKTKSDIIKCDETQNLHFIDKIQIKEILKSKDKIHPKLKLPIHYPSQQVFEHIFDLG